MKLRPKKTLWIISSLVTVVILSQLVSSCLAFRMSPEKTKREFSEANLEVPQLARIHTDSGEISYAYLNSGNKNLVIFIHGAPGSWSAFVDYFKDNTLTSTVDLLAIDRPGYGYSNFGHADTSLQSQAYQMAEVARQFPEHRKIWIGHSFGGPVVARVAIDYPELVQGMALVAPSIAPEQEKQEWYRPWLRTNLARWLLPKAFWVTNEEIYFLKRELIEMKPHWKHISIPTIVIQGEKDNLVPPENADFAQQMLPSDVLTVWRVEDMNHFVPWSHPHLIKKAIKELSR